MEDNYKTETTFVCTYNVICITLIQHTDNSYKKFQAPNLGINSFSCSPQEVTKKRTSLRQARHILEFSLMLRQYQHSRKVDYANEKKKESIIGFLIPWDKLRVCLDQFIFIASFCFALTA